MKHKFAGKTCVYCGKAQADSADHVLARKFFLADRRDNLPQVPACLRCNGLKSELENYLMAVLSFGAKHPDALANLEGQVAHRLEHPSNAKLLHRMKEEFDRSGGVSIGVDSGQVERLFEMVARGLAWQHFGVLLGDGFSASAALFSNSAKSGVAQMLASAEARVSGDLGQGTFTYEGAQGKYPESTIWRFSIYGGIEFGGDPRVSGSSSLIVATTERSENIRNRKYQKWLQDRPLSKIGRNESCPCGGGKKYKKCHGSPSATAHDYQQEPRPH